MGQDGPKSVHARPDNSGQCRGLVVMDKAVERLFFLIALIA